MGILSHLVISGCPFFMGGIEEIKEGIGKQIADINERLKRLKRKRADIPFEEQAEQEVAERFQLESQRDTLKGILGK